MDVRLSNAGGYKTSIPDYRIKPNSKSSEADNYSIENVYTTGELKKLEIQGVTVSKGKNRP